MMRLLVPLVIPFLLAACVSNVEGVPSWLSRALGARDEFIVARLRGDEAVGRNAFTRALDAMRDGGSVSGILDLQLTACALRLARLERPGCDLSSFVGGGADLSRAQLAYLALLQVRIREEDVALLPDKYRVFALALLRKDRESMRREVARMDDSVSRIIAAGIAHSAMLADEPLLMLAAEVARQRGLRATHLAFDQVLLEQLERRGDQQAVERLRARLRVLQ